MKTFFPIFRAGKHTDSAGKVHEYTEADVQELYENYDPDWLSAPFSTDHKEDGPAFGYAKDLKYEGGILYASFEDMNDDLRQAVKDKQFGRVSIELFSLPEKGRYLKAISLLGVKTPAIRGLEGEIRKQTQFSQTETDHIISFEAEVSDEGVMKLKESAAEESKPGDPVSYSESASSVAFEELSQQVTKLEEERNDLASKFEQSESERKQAETRLLEISIEQTRLDFEQYLESKIAYASIQPRQKDKILELLMALSSVEKFSEAEEGQYGLVAKFQQFLDELPAQIDSEIPRGSEKKSAESPQELAREIVSYMQQKAKDGVTVTYTEAINYLKNHKSNEK